MKRFLLSLMVAFAAITTVFGQVLMPAPVKAQFAPAESTLEWIELFDVDVTEISGVGTASAGIELAAGMTFNKTFLADYVGKTINVVAINVYSPLTDVTVEVRKGDDINSAEVVATETAGMMSAGWNIVKLEAPVEIDGTEGISIVYKANDTGDYPLGFDGSKNAPQGSAYISVQGQPLAQDLQFGALLIRALVGGDENELANNIILSDVKGVRNLEKGNPAEFELTLVNNTFTTVENITMATEINGEQKEEVITFDTPLENNSAATLNFTSEPLNENTTFKFTISHVNGVENPSATTIEKTVSVFEPGTMVQRTILIEKFTTQNCGYCPGGEQTILKAIEGQEEFVARIDHHYGYGEDIFTMTESKKIGQFFGVAGAPSCMMDRAQQDDRTGQAAGITWHPGYMTADMVANEIAKPAFVSIEITSEFNSDTKELAVNVKGKGLVDMTGKKINVVLTQSGYEAAQSGAGAGWKHNDFPIIFLTEYNGDALVADAEGNFDMNFSCTIKDSYSNSYGTRKVDFSQLKLVAFVTDWDKKDSSEVYNAASATVDAPIGINETTANVYFYTADNKVAVEGNCSEINVYDITGAQVENKDLNGMYIVKAVVDGKTYVQKVVVK